MLSYADGRLLQDSTVFSSTVGMMLHMDPVEIDIEPAGNFQTLLDNIQLSYESSRTVPVPICSLDGVGEAEFHGQVGLGFNFTAMQSAHLKARASRPLSARAEQRPADFSLRVRADEYQVPFQPILVGVGGSATDLHISVQFNANLIDEGEQAGLIHGLLDALRAGDRI
jgi:hypothetical protein